MPSRFARAVAWIGAGLFVAALLYFLYAYAITFAEIRPGRFDAGAIVADVLLFSGFALHHSVFARGAVRRWMARVVPAYLERSLYVWIASALFIVVCATWRYVQGVVWYVDGPGAWVLHAAQAAGVLLTIVAARALDVFELAGIRQLDPQPPSPTEFKTTGPYGWVRHPIYAGWFLMVWPVPLMTMTRLVFAAVSCVYLVIAIPLEERTMRRTSGGAYNAYARVVRWRLVPFLY